jgi:hypothetical protein
MEKKPIGRVNVFLFLERIPAHDSYKIFLWKKGTKVERLGGKKFWNDKI